MATAKGSAKKKGKVRRRRIIEDDEVDNSTSRRERKATRRADSSTILPPDNTSRTVLDKKKVKYSEIRVKATRTGYYDLELKHEGDKFTYRLRDGHKLPTWVEAVNARDAHLESPRVGEEGHFLEGDPNNNGDVIDNEDGTDEDDGDEDEDDNEDKI